MVCSHCSDEMKYEFQKGMIRDPDYYVGKYIKMKFEDENGSEHMWVRIVGVFNDDLVDNIDKLVGSLSNNPSVVHMSFGDMVYLTLEEIEAVHD